MTKLFSTVAGALLAASLAAPALAETAFEHALAGGAERLSADQIAERLAGKTVTFEQAASGTGFLVFYDVANGMKIRKVGGDKVMDGFYAVTASDHICFGIRGDKPIRLRCVAVLEIDGTLTKFELDGSLRGRIVEEVDGNAV